MIQTQDVLFEEMKGKDGDLGIITLNRPKVLNSLNHDMMVAMLAQLNKWATAVHIKAVVIRAAEGRAFCAGGDLRLLHERRTASDPAATLFFREEYQLNKLIHHFPKPYIAFLDGITMGGGVGISLHGSHRVATERLLFAMPETGIGFFPDVGGTYFLPRLPGRLGYYLGLTGARMGSEDCVALGVANHKVLSTALPLLLSALASQSLNNDADVSNIIKQFDAPISQPVLLEQQAIIDDCFAFDNMEEIVQRLKISHHTVCQEALTMLQKKSPTSLKVTLRAMQKGHQLDFDAVMQQEFRLTTHFCEKHDFIEGIRALIIDKDQTPVWVPATLEAVTEQMVEDYFQPIPDELN
ncbi:MAG: enoyl-CoA hydratase/isomerase family protein [Gammaproteobacteria bacterium]